MHKLNILILAPKSFIISLIELKSYLKFDISEYQEKISNVSLDKIDGFVCHEENLIKFKSDILNKIKCFKILISRKKNNTYKNFDYFLKLPASLKEINNIIETSAVKKRFNKNSSIKIKSYLMDKNEKKLIKNGKFIILTEKEIQLLELLLNKNKSISKNDILSLVWNYSKDADTHTVETHIYRLRKKVSHKFTDDNFILNNKNGYYL